MGKIFGQSRIEQSKSEFLDLSFSKQSVWWITRCGLIPNTGQVLLGKEMVLTGKVVDKKLLIEYGEGWKDYLYDADYPGFKDLVQSLNEKLEGAGKKGSKGLGKFGAKAWTGKGVGL
jgi:hypothetical protein